MDIFSVIALFGGIGFFLFGMSLMGDGLKKAAGSKLEYYLWQFSSTPLRGFFLGLIVTAVIQSSSATTVMAISFVNAGMMTLSQTIGIILGAGIGTTMTGWILTISSLSGSGVLGKLMSTSNLVSVLSLIGILLYFFAKKTSLKNIGSILMGLATLLLSMTLISDAVSPLKSSESFRGILLMFSNPILGLLAGIFIAAVIQSCSAGVGILQALSVTGALTYNACVPLIIGINIGASSPVMLSMIGAKKDGRRTALVYLYSSILGGIIIYLLYYPMRMLNLLPIADGIANTFGIAIVNTGMKVLSTVILLPGYKIIEKLIYATIKYDPSENEDEKEIKNLEKSLLQYPPVAIQQSKSAVIAMTKIAKTNVFNAIECISNYSKKEINKISEKELLVDKYEDKLGDYLIKITANELSEEQQKEVTEYLSIIGDLERLSDHSVNICEVAEEINEKKIIFSEKAQKEIESLTNAVKEIVSITLDSFVNNDIEPAYTVESLEETIDILCKELKLRHAKRLQNGECTIELGFVFNDLLNNYERIADHCSNIAFSTVQKNTNKNEAHKYSMSLAETEEFKKALEEYKGKYLTSMNI